MKEKIELKINHINKNANGNLKIITFKLNLLTICVLNFKKKKSRHFLALKKLYNTINHSFSDGESSGEENNSDVIF